MKLITVELSALLASHLLLRFAPMEVPITLTPSQFFLLCGLSLLCVTDLSFIFANQGWSSLFFRPPLLNDQERNLILVNSIMRGGGSPFLAHTPLSYPTFWHELSASLAGALGPTANLKTIFGFSLGTGFLFFLFILIMTTTVKPSLLETRWQLLGIALIFSFHTDILNFLLSLFLHGRPGIESDGSFPGPLLYRYFSPKLVALTAPQHAMFLCVALCTLISPITPMAFVALGTLISPALAILFFIPLASVRGFQRQHRKKEITSLFFGLVAGSALVKWVYGLPPWDLVSHPQVSKMVFLPSWWGHWVGLPLLLVGTCGVTGLLLSALLIKHFRNGHSLSFSIVFLVLGNFAVNNLFAEMELKRHLSILSTAVSLYLLMEFWPKRISKRLFASIALVAVTLHGYFLYSYLGKPSQLDPSIPWKDYLSMNDLLRNKYPQLKIISANSPKSGIDFPLALEATTAFANPLNALVYGKLSQVQLGLLRKSEEAGTVLPYAQRLGYTAVLLGPLEEREWDLKTKRRFVDPGLKIDAVGTVGLYRLTDRIKNQFENEPEKESADFYLRVADALEKEGWISEATGFRITASQIVTTPTVHQNTYNPPTVLAGSTSERKVNE